MVEVAGDGRAALALMALSVRPKQARPRWQVVVPQDVASGKGSCVGSDNLYDCHAPAILSELPHRADPQLKAGPAIEPNEDGGQLNQRQASPCDCEDSSHLVEGRHGATILAVAWPGRHLPAMIAEPPQHSGSMASLFHRKAPETSIAVGSDRSSTEPPARLGLQPADVSTLPLALTKLVGRAAEVEAVTKLVSAERLVTLVGPGGIGKTRLAIAAGYAVRPDFRDGVRMADLSAVNAPNLVAKAVGAAVGIPDEPGRTALESLEHHLAGAVQLIIVDNCEHLIAPAAEVVDRVLKSCAGVRVLATSREALQVSGEMTWPVPPLPVPTEKSSEATAATELFLERAREVRPGFVPSPDEAVAIGAICRRLDGLPLAIELAAARMRHLTVDEIASRLDERFRLLTGGSRTALPRQRTLEAAVRWSFDLLDVSERRLFNRLSVFAGPFVLQAAETVGRDLNVDVLDGLGELADKSLITTEPSGNVTRYRMLETLRAFGRDRLVESGDAVAARAAHLAWVDDLATRAAAEIDGPHQHAWLATLDAEIPNIRVALDWAAEGGDATAAALIASRLYRYWYLRSVREGHKALDRLLPHARLTDTDEAMALFARGVLTTTEGDFGGGARDLEQSLATFRKAGDLHGIALAQHYLGRSLWSAEQSARVRELFETSLARFRDESDQANMALSLMLLVVWELQWGSTEAAKRYLDELGEIADRLKAPQFLAHWAELTAVRLCMQSDVDGARPGLVRAFELYRQISNRGCSAHCAESAARYFATVGRFDEATMMLGAMDRVREDLGVTNVPVYETWFHESVEDACRKALGEKAYAARWDDGHGITYEELHDRALTMLGTPI